MIPWWGLLLVIVVFLGAVAGVALIVVCVRQHRVSNEDRVERAEAISRTGSRLAEIKASQRDLRRNTSDCDRSTCSRTPSVASHSHCCNSSDDSESVDLGIDEAFPRDSPSDGALVNAKEEVSLLVRRVSTSSDDGCVVALSGVADDAGGSQKRAAGTNSPDSDAKDAAPLPGRSTHQVNSSQQNSFHSASAGLDRSETADAASRGGVHGTFCTGSDDEEGVVILRSPHNNQSFSVHNSSLSSASAHRSPRPGVAPNGVLAGDPLSSLSPEHGNAVGALAGANVASSTVSQRSSTRATPVQGSLQTTPRPHRKTFGGLACIDRAREAFDADAYLRKRGSGTNLAQRTLSDRTQPSSSTSVTPTPPSRDPPVVPAPQPSLTSALQPKTLGTPQSDAPSTPPCSPAPATCTPIAVTADEGVTDVDAVTEVVLSEPGMSNGATDAVVTVLAVDPSIGESAVSELHEGDGDVVCSLSEQRRRCWESCTQALETAPAWQVPTDVVAAYQMHLDGDALPELPHTYYTLDL